MKAERGKIKKMVMLACVSIAFLFPLFSFHSLHAQYRVEHLSKPINTAGSETGAFVLGDTVLVYSSLPPASQRRKITSFVGLRPAPMQLYQARIARNGKLGRPHADRWGLNDKGKHSGNIAIDPLTKDLYFTRGDLVTQRCDIFVAKKKKRRGWEKPVKLAGPINSSNHTATQPTIAHTPEGNVILYFASDRPGTLGGMDIWYTLVEGTTTTECVNLGPLVNSSSDEITPFYDPRNGVLYFSSNREGGKGGYDIYCADGARNRWRQAEGVCGCLNSEQNDLYFNIVRHDSVTGRPLMGFLASNRSDSYYLNDSLCCNDIYEWKVDSAEWEVVIDTVPDTLNHESISHIPLSTFHFPLFLYFHNDEPDPTSRKGTTEISYADCQRRYAQLRGEYVGRQTSAGDSAMMEEFFDSCVVGNYERVEALFDYVEEQLDEGKGVVLTISGYASPVFQNEYNQLLSERRIASFINMLSAWRGGLFADAMDDHRLTVEQKPMGIDHLSTLNSQLSTSQNPIYSLPAALARRIEILSCEIR